MPPFGSKKYGQIQTITPHAVGLWSLFILTLSEIVFFVLVSICCCLSRGQVVVVVMVGVGVAGVGVWVRDGRCGRGESLAVFGIRWFDGYISRGFSVNSHFFH